MARVTPAFHMAMTGDKEMKKKLERVAGDQGMRKEARTATIEVGGELLDRMKARTPVKTGKLQRSERLLVMVSPKKEDIRLSLIAGGGPENVLYARKVHETHKTHSKFMESVIFEAAPTAGQQIAAKIDLQRAAGA